MYMIGLRYGDAYFHVLDDKGVVSIFIKMRNMYFEYVIF